MFLASCCSTFLNFYGLFVGEDLPIREAAEILATSPRADFGDMLEALKRDELKAICRALAMDASGKEKAVIVVRLVDAVSTIAQTRRRQRPLPHRRPQSRRRKRRRSSPRSSIRPSHSRHRSPDHHSYAQLLPLLFPPLLERGRGLPRPRSSHRASERWSSSASRRKSGASSCLTHSCLQRRHRPSRLWPRGPR